MAEKSEVEQAVAEPAPQAQPAPKPNKADQGDYTAVIYFHGIGTPRRYEEVSRLTDALDQFAQTQDEGGVGRLRQQDVAFEPSRVAGEDDIAYVHLTRIVKRFGNQFRQEGRYRIYDGFWSPFAAGGIPAFHVLVWVLGRLLNPILVLTRPWRTHQRLKLCTLYQMCVRDGALTEDSYRQLESHYSDFESWPARRKYPRGRFKEFKSFLLDKHQADRDFGKILEGLAGRWRRKFIVSQLVVIAISVMVAFSLFMTLAVGSVAMVLVYQTVAAGLSWPDIKNGLVGTSDPWPLAFSAVIAAYAAFFVGLIYFGNHFLKNFFADVMFWTTFDEKNVRFAKRRDIIRAGERVLLQVLRDPSCKRIVVIGHSLGSAIAYECLLRLGRQKSARKSDQPFLPFELQRLDIISHLVTVGSPIDRIHYFFELQSSRYHRYNRIYDRLLGNAGNPPFKDGALRATTWINIWDDVDPISSRLYSPRDKLPNREAITDIHVRSSHLAYMVSAHTDYFFANDGIQVMFWLLIFGRLPKQIGPAAIGRAQRFIFNMVRPAYRAMVAIIFPGLFIYYSATLLTYLWSRQTFGLKMMFFVATASGLIFFVLWAIGRVADRRWPLQLVAGGTRN